MMVVVVRGLLLDSLHGGTWDVWVDFGDVSNGLGASLPKHHPCVWSEVLWILDEAESTGSLVSCPEVVLVHGDYGGCLPCAPTMNYREMHDMYVHVT